MGTFRVMGLAAKLGQLKANSTGLMLRVLACRKGGPHNISSIKLKTKKKGLKFAPSVKTSKTTDLLAALAAKSKPSPIPTSVVVRPQPVAAAHSAPIPMGSSRTRKAVETFATALVHPFNPEAVGCKVPDLFSFPTTAYHTRATFTMGGTSTNTTGNFGFVAMPSPYATLFDISTSGQCVITKGGAVRFPNLTNVYGLSLESQMASVCTDWRMVGGGIRIRNLQAPISAQGRIYVAVVPVTDGLPPQLYLNSGTTSGVPNSTGLDAIYANCGLPTAALMNSSAIQNLPLANDYVVSSLVAGDEIDINFPVFHPHFYTFKCGASDYRYNSTSNQGDWGLTATSSLSSNPGIRDNMSIQGSAAIVVYCEGFPTTQSSFLELDIIQHFECTPVVATSSSSGIQPTPASLPAVQEGSSALVEKVLSISNRPNNILKEVQSGLAAARDLDTAVTGGRLTKLVNGPGRKIMSGLTMGMSDMFF